MSKIDNNLGNIIKIFRKNANLTQLELARLLGVSFSTLRRWEVYGGQPRTDELKKLCEVLGCTETELLNGPDDGKIKITLVYDWDQMKEGNIDMNGNEFELILGSQGKIGLKGAGTITSREAIDEFLGRIRSELEIALDAQIKRGVVQEG